MTEVAYCEKNPATPGCPTKDDITKPSSCGDEKISISEGMMQMGGIGMPGKPRWPFALTEEEVTCKTDCKFISEFEISEVLVSSDPNCPITNLKIMEDDGNGQPLS
jgi:hypothetical protein